MDQVLLPRNASGPGRYEQRPPHHRNRTWVHLSGGLHTQAGLRYVYLADAIVSAHSHAQTLTATVDRQLALANFKVALWLFVAVFISGGVSLLVGGPVPRIATGLLLAAACLIAAGAADRYQRAQG